MAMMLKMVIHRDLCCGDCALCYRSTCGIKGKEKEFSLVLEPEGSMGFPRFRAFLLLFLILCFPISLSKSPRILAAEPGCALRKGM